MNKILPIILVVVLSGCATSPQYYDIRNVSWNELEECNLSIPECIASNEVCLKNPSKCRFKPYVYVHECKDTPAECRHEKAMISQKVTSILIGERDSARGNGRWWSSIWTTYEWKNKRLL